MTTLTESENRHRPSIWIGNQQTQALIAEVAKAGNTALKTVKGGNASGTFVAWQLVYAYAERAITFVGFTRDDSKSIMDPMNATPISPCPFCASKDANLVEVDESGWAVICGSCGGIGPVGLNQADSIDQWNGRHALARNLSLAHSGAE